MSQSDHNTQQGGSAKIDEWVWGRERIIWGYANDHLYTLKLLEPKRGRMGCLSLQYHHKKSESWVVYRGVAWALMVFGGKVCTRIMRAGDVQNLPAGVIHRIMGVTEDLQVIEPSTPDQHAADKAVAKDVVRLHCVHGREVVLPRNDSEARIVAECVGLTEEAIRLVEKGEVPPEYRLDTAMQNGGSSLNP